MCVIVGCERSQKVTIALRKRGIEAYSCDLECEYGGYPEWHFQCDLFYAIKYINPRAGIFFPPCDHLATSGNRWREEKKKDGRQKEAVDFFNRIALLRIPKAIENPVGIMSTLYRKPDQIIQPWMFGHGETKSTCLWLSRLPKLFPTKIVDGREQNIWLMPPSDFRKVLRSQTYDGIANAMADQWTPYFERL